MTLTAPLALALSAVAVPIVLMYILKLRRQEQVVPSMLLWRRITEDVQANAPWQRLRRNLLLLLQLLALLALVLILAGPAYTQAQSFDGDVIVIVDQSYAMQARDVSPSRFAAALQKAHQLAADLGAGHVMSVIGMGAQPHLAVVESNDRGVIDHAIDSLRVGVAPPNLLGAYSLAASLARRGQNTRVVILTSRESGIAGVPLQAPVFTEIVRIGGRLRDLGITAFSADDSGQALVRVGNFGSDTARSDFQLFADGQLIDVRPLKIAPGKEQTLFWTHLSAGFQQLRAFLTRRDDMTADKNAWYVLRGRVQHRVLLVSAKDYFLRTALALAPGVELQTVAPQVYTPSLDRSYDLIVFDGVLPSTMPTTAALLIGPPAGRVGQIRFGRQFPAGSAVEPVSGSLSATLLQDANLGDVHVARARATTLPGWLQSIAAAGPLPLIVAGDSGSARLAAVTFNLKESDWPLRVSFPLVLQNLLQFLAPSVTPDAGSLVTGRPVTLYPSPGTRAIDVTSPDGNVHVLRSPFPPFTDTSQVGIYRVREVGSSTHTAAFAVNFFPAHAAPASGPAVIDLGRASGSRRTTSTVVGIAWLFGAIWLGLLSAEWWMSFRR